MSYHTETKQPKDTRGKLVEYRCFDCEFWHHKYPADELDWNRLSKDGKPYLGRIVEYRIVG